MIGQKLGSFTIDEKIGAGAMGEVYKATQRLKDGRTRTAAVKVVASDFLERDIALKRFEREAEILAQLRHPNIVRYYAHGRYKGTYYYAMEFVEGETLDDLLKRREMLPWREVVDLGIQLCQALQYAHDHQVVHRDLKPSNLMITADGPVEADRLRDRQGPGRDGEPDADRAHAGHGGLHGAGADPRHAGRSATRRTSTPWGACSTRCSPAGRRSRGRSAVVLMHSHMADPPPRPSERTPGRPARRWTTWSCS